METLYGQYPKHIICQCNSEEMKGDAITISLNDRCPICNQTRQICVPKPAVKMKVLEHAGAHTVQAA